MHVVLQTCCDALDLMSHNTVYMHVRQWHSVEQRLAYQKMMPERALSISNQTSPKYHTLQFIKPSVMQSM